MSTHMLEQRVQTGAGVSRDDLRAIFRPLGGWIGTSDGLTDARGDSYFDDRITVVALSGMALELQLLDAEPAVTADGRKGYTLADSQRAKAVQPHNTSKFRVLHPSGAVDSCADGGTDSRVPLVKFVVSHEPMFTRRAEPALTLIAGSDSTKQPTGEPWIEDESILNALADAVRVWPI